ncbi:MAG: M23 family metallopeptidase [Holosporales bacterium]|jgi:murein DD-endopeptidase MepM/ murein hydrolase activator NlpD|nr:M23 family metallopeptidase [Holosporales bacterium]
MIATRSQHFLSICLLALASVISITEYCSYSPTNQNSLDEDVATVSSAENVNDSVDATKDEKDESSPDTQKDVSNNKDENSVEQNQKIPDQRVVSNNTTQKQSEPFVESSEYKAVVSTGDTISSILGNLGFDKIDVYLASKELSKVFNLRNLKAGQEIIIHGKRNASKELVLNGIELRPTHSAKIVVTRTNSGFSTEKVDVPVKKVIRSIHGAITPKAPEFSLKQCGVKPQIAREALRNLSQVVDIRNAKSSIDFEFLYKDFYDNDGNMVKSPELMYISVLNNGKITRLYKFTDNGTSEYVDANGVIIKTLANSRSMLASPLDHMKITSPYGTRRTPNGRIENHKGIDLSASIGTPVKATANGIVTKASYVSGYGLYIEIQHNGSISTAYAHLSRIVARKGQRVSQRQIIGYSGASGKARGAHLHYGVYKGGSSINPMSFIKQEPQKLTGNKLHKFNQFKKDISLQIVGLTPVDKRSKHNYN